MSARVTVAAVGLVIVLVAVAALVAANAVPTVAGSCPPLEGGGSRGRTQVRFLDARDDHVTFTFGRSAGADFDIPHYRVVQLESDHRAFRARFGGSSTVNPDGTPSIEGLTRIQPEDRLLREVRFVEDRDGDSVWDVAAADTVCPRVALKSYVVGTFPRVQLILSFGNASSITLEPNPPLGPQIWVSGAGFAPSSSVRIALGGSAVDRAPTAPDGTFEKGLFVYDLEPGIYRVTARDARGHSASNQLTVPREPFVPDLVPRR